MKLKRWEMPRLIILVRPNPIDGVQVLQGCKTFTTAGPGDVDKCGLPESESCLAIQAS